MDLEMNSTIIINTSNIERRLQKKLNLDEKIIQEICLEYKKFLFLAKKYPNVVLVPGPLVDEVWHDHILHTKQYQEDCQRIFGHYVHHNPSLNEEGEDINETFELYQQEFGSIPPNDYWGCQNIQCTKCCGNTCGKNCGKHCKN